MEVIKKIAGKYNVTFSDEVEKELSSKLEHKEFLKGETFLEQG